MTKKEMIAALAERAELTHKEVERVADVLADLIGEELTRGEKFTLPGVGSFEQSHRAARTGRNPQTGETIQIKASVGVRFKALKRLKDLLN